MARLNTAENYRDALLALLPQGQAWPTDIDSEMGRLMMGIAEEFAHVEQRAQDLLDESHPSKAAELFPEWEQAHSLPNKCVTTEQTMVERRAALIQAYQAYGGQSREFFIAVAAALGYSITITEFEPMQVGFAAGDPCCGEDWAFAWQVNAPETTLRNFLVGTSVAGEPLSSWGNELLECVIKRLVHSHRVVRFSYGGA